jgi:D-glycero-D-manno-heptose 1,7-bisphosphate phosphatase
MGEYIVIVRPSLIRYGVQRAVFLDRDGVINRAYIRHGKPFPARSIGDFEILPNVPEACERLKAVGFVLIIVTNQPDVGRGSLARETVESIHTHMCKALPIDRVEVSYSAGDEKVPDECRKPRPGMLLRAAQELDIDLRQSWMVGDRWSDVACGQAAGCRTVFIDYAYDEPLPVSPDFRARDLLEAVETICIHSRKDES